MTLSTALHIRATTMSSPTKATESKRLHKRRTNGRKHKRNRSKNGTTRTEAELFGNVLPRTPAAS